MASLGFTLACEWVPSPMNEIDLQSLFNILKAHNYPVTTSQLVSAYRLLAAVIIASDAPNADRLTAMLTPIFAGSKREQDGMKPLIRGWLDVRSPPENIEDEDKPAIPKALDEIDEKTSGRRYWRIGFAAAFVLIVAGLVYVGWDMELRSEPHVEHPSEPPKKSANDYKIEKERIDVDSTSVKQNVPPAAKNEDKERTVAAAKVVFSAIPILAFVLWYAWRQRTLNYWLSRRKANGPVRLENLHARSELLRHTHSSNFFSIVRNFRKPKIHVSNDLNIAETINNFVISLGSFTPVYLKRRYSPEYLILVQSNTPGDQLALYLVDYVNSLRSEGVYVDVFSYNGDPRICRDAQGAIDLDDLVGRFASRRLIIIDDCAAYFDPFSRQLGAWTEVFSAWNEKAVLSTASSDTWGWNESELIQADFLVLPANESSLHLLSTLFANHDGRLVEAGLYLPSNMEGTPALPAFLAPGAPERKATKENRNPWTDSDLKKLQDYLGTFCFYWLCVCAVYPVLRWHITSHLGVRLSELARHTHPNLTYSITFLRLPFFRSGYMPDSLRRALLNIAPPEVKQAARESLGRLLLSGVLTPGGSGLIPLASLNEQPSQRLIRAFLSTEPSESPLRDELFLKVMDDEGAKETDFNLTELISRLKGQSITRPITVGTAAAIAFVTAASIWLLFSFGLGSILQVKADSVDFVVLASVVVLMAYYALIYFAYFASLEARQALEKEFERRRAAHMR